MALGKGVKFPGVLASILRSGSATQDVRSLHFLGSAENALGSRLVEGLVTTLSA